MKLLFVKIGLAILIFFGFLWLIKILLNESSQDMVSPLNPDRIPVQEFFFSLNKDTIFTGKEGTVLKINKDAFIDCQGKPVEGRIRINLKEIYSKPDIILSGITTTSDGQILETGGALYLNAYQGEKTLCVNDTAKISVIVPAGEVRRDMKLYRGRFFDNTAKINWTDPEELLNNYVFETGNLGWLSIERLVDKMNAEEISLVVSVNNRKDYKYLIMRMIYLNLGICLDGFEAGKNRFVFGNNYAENLKLPVGEPVIVFAVAQREERPYIGMQEFILGKNNVSTLNLKETTTEEMEALIEAWFSEDKE
ncbi:MAG: hypothetical protein JXR41_12775 [Bacteroidales bacterium]|nr:hypothetical protein [Bacteroidales bacterium]